MFLISVGRPAVRFSRSAEGGAARCRAAPVSPDFGGYSERETPLPIPNRAVKPLSADGTWLARAWESRSPPILHVGRLRAALVVAGGLARPDPAVLAPRRSPVPPTRPGAEAIAPRRPPRARASLGPRPTSSAPGGLQPAASSALGRPLHGPPRASQDARLRRAGGRRARWPSSVAKGCRPPRSAAPRLGGCPPPRSS